jgi:hypothetical protein
MSILQVRNEVRFDASNIEHRKLFHNFIIEGKWKPGSLKFYLEPQFLTVPDMIKYHLNEYYLALEFGQA